MKDEPLYAPHSGAHQEDLDMGGSFLSGDFEASGLIKEELPDETPFYYVKARDIDELAMGGCWNPKIP